MFWEENKFVKSYVVKRFKKMCIFIFLSWSETILWKNVWRKELWELSYVEIVNLMKDFELNDFVLFEIAWNPSLDRK